jgi:hypothetical protein
MARITDKNNDLKSGLKIWPVGNPNGIVQFYFKKNPVIPGFKIENSRLKIWNPDFPFCRTLEKPQ